MKQTIRIIALSVFTFFILSGCGSVFHNGTEMDLASVTVTGLPANPYTPDQPMVFSYNKGTIWVHDDTDFADAKYQGKVSAEGSITFVFNPPLKIVTPTLTFLLIDPSKTWATFQLDKKHSGKKGGDVVLDNTWAGVTAPVTVKGVVSGDDVTWTLE